nr:MAG TPA: hypothetical protein [Caudoviricetes sp.]
MVTYNKHITCTYISFVLSFESQCDLQRKRFLLIIHRKNLNNCSI